MATGLFINAAPSPANYEPLEDKNQVLVTTADVWAFTMWQAYDNFIYTLIWCL